MQLFLYLLSLALATVSLASPVSEGSVLIRSHRTQYHQVTTGKAIYFLTNNARNSVAAIKINQLNGLLNDATLTATAGAGSVVVNMEGKPATPDALVGQSALTVAGNVR